MRRSLCPVEYFYVAQRSRAVVSCTVRGALDVDALSDALADIVARHPSLRCGVIQDESGFALQELDAPPRLEIFGAEHDYDEVLNTPLLADGALFRAVLLRGDESDTLVLVVDHVIIDGHSSLALLNALWERYAEVAANPDAQREPYRTELPAPVTELLPAVSEYDAAVHFKRRAQVVRSRPVELLRYDAAQRPAGGRIAVSRLLLDHEQTAALRRTAAEADVSMHGLLCAALLLTARRRLDGDGPRTLGCLSPVDLRSRMSPPLPRDTMVAAVAFHAEALDVDPSSDVFELARCVTSGLRSALAQNEPVKEVSIMPRVAELPALVSSTVIATNMGAVTGPRLPDCLELLDVRLVPAREQYFPQAGRSPVMACITTFNGRLAVEFPHWTECFTTSAMDSFRDELRAALLKLADKQSAVGGGQSR